MTETRTFHIGDILSITTSRLVSPRHMDAVYDLCNFMTGDNLFTHQLPRAADECVPVLQEQFPDLAQIAFPKGLRGQEAVLAWLNEQVAVHGETREVRPLTPGRHEHRDPLAELDQMIGPGRTMVVVAPDD